MLFCSEASGSLQHITSTEAADGTHEQATYARGANLKPRIITGAVMLVGLVILVIALRPRAASVTESGANVSSERSKSSSRSGSWLGDSESDTSPSRNPSWTDAEEIQRQSKQRERELKAAAQVKRSLGGEAGGPAILPRYASDPRGIGLAIVGVTPALRACYESVGRDKAKLPDDVHVRLTIVPDPNHPNRGIVMRAETAETAFRHPAVEGCLQNAVSTLTFDRVSRPMEVNLPLVLARRN